MDGIPRDRVNRCLAALGRLVVRRVVFLVATALAASAFSTAATAGVPHPTAPDTEVGGAGDAGCHTARTPKRRLSDVGRIAQRPGIPFNSDVFMRFNLPPLKTKKRAKDAACSA